MKLYVKNMVCNRCIMVVSQLMHENGYEPVSISLGEVDLGDVELDAYAVSVIERGLLQLGFELIDDKRSRLVSQIKSLIIQLVHHQEDALKVNLSDYLAGELNHDYGYLSNLFSGVEGTTIEQYSIAQKIERVKELMVYDELTLSEIAVKLGYSSVAHLSNQFKKATGLSPSHFKNIKAIRRRPLDQV